MESERGSPSAVEIPGYRLKRIVGRGGGGTVYEAEQISIARTVAVKLLRSDLREDPEFVTRFRREAELQARLDHPGIVDVYEAGESEHALYIAMRFIEGASLERELAEGVLTADRALRVLTQVAAALDAAHGAGIVHGDVKPRNVLIEPDGTAYLADFGLTRQIGRTRVTLDGAVLGTANYLAPEVIFGEPASPASDLYAFAAMAFECLTGSVPFPRGVPAAVLYAHTAEEPPAASEVRSSLPSRLDPVLATGLAKDSRARGSGAADFVERVADAIGSELRATLEAPPAATASERTPSGGGGAAIPRRPRRWGVAVASALVGCAAGVGIVALLDDDDSAGADPAAEVAPNVPGHATIVGSSYADSDFALVDCGGEKATLSSRPCSLAQASNGREPLTMPDDGLISSWSVRGQGDLTLQVIRPRNQGAFQAARSEHRFVPDERWHTFETNLPVTAGDRISVELGPGASVGIAPTPGATLQRWFPVLRGFTERPSAPAPDFEGELLVQAHYVPGGSPVQPRQLHGRAAEDAPAGKVVDEGVLKLTNGDQIGLKLVASAGRVWADAFDGGRRLARVEVRGAVPGGESVAFEPFNYIEEEAYGELHIAYTNESSSSVIEHYYGVSASGFDPYD